MLKSWIGRLGLSRGIVVLPSILLLLSFAAVSVVAQESSGRTPPAGIMVFFPFDDYSIPWKNNLKFTMQKPVKYPDNPVLRNGPSGSVDDIGAILYGTVIQEENKLRMWYLAWPQPDSRIPGDAEFLKTYRPIGYAESEDGIHWTKPNLNLVTFRGNKNNNLVLVEPESAEYSKTSDFISILMDEDDPDPNRRYKMAYITEDSKRLNASTATAVSPDGFRWKLVNEDMISGGHFENTSLIKFQGMFYAAGQNLEGWGGNLPDGSPAGRTMTVFFSPDFRTWSKERAFSFYRSDYQPAPIVKGQEVHMGAGLWNRGNVILGVYGRWYGDTVTGKPVRLGGLKMDLGFLVSNDAIHYREPVRNFIFLERGSVPDWDSESLLQGNALANVGDKTLIWYSHWYTSLTYPLPHLPEQVQRKPQAIGLASLPRDRFAYFSKITTEPRKNNAGVVTLTPDASFLSAPFSPAEGFRMYANVDKVSDTAPLTVSLHDINGQPIPGYTTKLTQSGFKTPIVWPLGAGLPLGRQIRLKVTWPAHADPHLYAIYVDR
jgi:hypothetical protein